MHIMSMLWFITKAVRSGSCPILFKVLTLNVAISIVRFHFSNFCFSLSSEADFSNTWARVPTSAGRAPFLPARRAMWFGLIWVWVMIIFRWLCFILMYRNHPNRWAAVVPRSNYLILAIVSWGLEKAWADIDRLSVIWKSDLTDRIKHCFFPSSGCVDTAIWMHHIEVWRKTLTAITQECCEQYWTSPEGSTQQNGSCTATYHSSRKLSKLDRPDMRDTAGEVRTNS